MDFFTIHKVTAMARNWYIIEMIPSVKPVLKSLTLEPHKCEKLYDVGKIVGILNHDST